jgi:murein DD-endopeptidase MepM/ murein hydrolase activator NlpD
MPKGKFIYNPKTLSYERVNRTWGERIVLGLIYIAPTVVLSIIFGFVIAYRLDSPNERRLRAELEESKLELSSMNTRFSLIEQVLDEMYKRDEELYRSALGAKEFPQELRMMGVGGSDAYKRFDGLSNAEMLKETSQKMDRIEGKLHAQSISFKELVRLVQEREQRLASLPAIQPVRNSDLKRVASGFGWRIDPVYKTKKMHWGLDFTADVGTEIYATGDGMVEEVKTSAWGYGREVLINHGFGYKTRYAHLSKFMVKEGQHVKRGEVIGLVGNSGKSTGPHLHYEVEKDGQKVNPINYFHSDLTPEQFEQIIEISKNAFRSLD